MTVEIITDEPVKVNGQLIPVTDAPVPPAGGSEWEGTFKDLTGFQFGKHPKGVNFTLPGIEVNGTKTVSFLQGGETIREVIVGNGTTFTLDTGGKYTTMYLQDGDGSTVKMDFNPSLGAVVPFRFVVSGSNYQFGCNYP